ncbi:TfoX/Sxy family protein [Nocardia farcinica]|uniref:TfoX/Sxy family protein n=1 Tax=Nocardia farcinica TaxID=37329 RepID=UPI0018939064|nr:TfoX/Sxy family protein [Nocardia farcinica]MBF6522087.1 TfoX/Sxy family protein [Nocardia farcinica]
MPFDPDLAERLRAVLAGTPALAEKRMFGGLAFLVGGNLAVAASHDGGLLVRVDPAEGERLLDDRRVVPMVMGGREMRGWLRVAPAAVDTDAALRAWVDRGVFYARSLPLK